MSDLRKHLSRRDFLRVSGAAGGFAALALAGCSAPAEAPASAPAGEENAPDVAGQEPITILINDSPWFPGFNAMVDKYVETTGNEVNLDVTPFAGMPDKTRNALQAEESEYDALAITEQNISFFYNSGLLMPITDIDPDYELDPDLISYGDAARWDFETNTPSPDGTILGIPINGNIQLYYYRSDIFEENGLEPPKTFDEMAAIAEQLYDPPNMFGNANRADPIWWEFSAYLNSFGAPHVQRQDDGKWAIGFEKPEARDAVEMWMLLGREWAPDNYADVGQGSLIALMASGRLAQVHMVGAAAPNFYDPDQSIVGGKMGATVVPGATADTRAPTSGMWVMSFAGNLPVERAQAGLEFVKWLTPKDRQVEYARAGAIPTSQGAYEELANDETLGWWTSAFAESTPFIVPEPRIPEIPEIRQSVMTRMAQMYVDEITVDEGLELMATEVRDIMVEAGYDVE
jgi:multiple sugar transport system substrate-binding protein